MTFTIKKHIKFFISSIAYVTFGYLGICWLNVVIHNLNTGYVYPEWNSSTFERFIQKTNRRWLNLPATCKHKTETSLHVPIATGYEITDDSCIFTTYPSNYRADATLEANSIRTAQIQLAQELMVLKGFAVDFYLENRQHFRIPLELVEQVYRRHGLLDEHESLDETWCKRNPSRCIL